MSPRGEPAAPARRPHADPTAGPGQLKTLRRLGAVCILFLLAVLAWFALDTAREYRTVRDDALDRQQQLARAVAGLVERQFDEVYAGIGTVGQMLQGHLDGQAARRAGQLAAVRDLIERNPFVDRLVAVDAAGRVLFESGRGPASDAALVDAARTALKGEVDGETFGIGTVLVGEDGRRRLPLVRATRLGPGDAASGQVIAHLNLDVLQRAFDALRPGEAEGDGAVALFRSDGVLLVRAPLRADLVNRRFSGPLMSVHLPRAPAGSFIDEVQTDGTLRIVGYARTGRFPLVVGTGLPAAEVFAHWRQVLLGKALAFALAALVLGALVWVGYRLMRHQLQLWGRQAESDRRFRDFADTVPAVVFATDATGATTYVNRRWNEVTGAPPDQAVSRRWGPHIHPDDLAGGALARWDDSVRRGAIHVSEYRLRGADGQYRWVLSRAEPVRDDQGRIVAFYGTVMDIDDLKQAERRIAAAEEAQRLLIADIPVGVVDVDAHGGVVSANPAWRRMFGFEPDAPLDGVNLRDLYVDPQQRHAVLKALNESPERRISYQAAFRRRDGATILVEGHAHAVVDADGKLHATRGVMLDVTERVALEAQLRQAQKMEAIGQLTGGIAHDFNNLLTVIMSNADLLTDALADDPRQRVLAEMIGAAAQRGADLTQSLLAFSRRQALSPRATDVNRLIERMEALLQRAVGEQIELAVLLGRDLWPATVDPAQLESAVLNLVVNARDAMPEGGKLTLETANAELGSAQAERHEGARPGAYVMIVVSDTGAGMAPEVMAKAFEPFFTTKEVGKGTGLGLSMVYGLVRQSGGHIRLYSEPGHGTTVKLYLPRAADAARPEATAAEAPVAVRGGGETVLMVEDDDLVRRNVQAMIADLGYHVLAARNAAEALELLRRRSDIDLLFTDVVMPGGLNGVQLAAEAARLRPSLKVLFTSGYTDSALVNQGKLERGADLLSKPYRRAALAERLRAALDGAAASP